jgi:hypothetical protein
MSSIVCPCGYGIANETVNKNIYGKDFVYDQGHLEEHKGGQYKALEAQLLNQASCR